MKERVSAAVVYGAIMLGICFLSAIYPMTFSLIWVLVLVQGCRELVYMKRLNRSEAFSVVLQGFSLLLPFVFGRGFAQFEVKALLLRGDMGPLPAGEMMLVLLLFAAWQFLFIGGRICIKMIKKGYDSLAEAVRVSAYGLYFSAPLFCANMILLYLPMGWSWLVLAIVTPWACDSFAWGIGTVLGKHKIFPLLSPNKTWEGFFGGIAGTMLLYAGVTLAVQAALKTSVLPLGLMLLFALVVSLAAQMGDLLESAIKRKAGVKDSGHLIPGHGGILDRFDSSLALFPVFFFAVSIAALLA